MLIWSDPFLSDQLSNVGMPFFHMAFNFERKSNGGIIAVPGILGLGPSLPTKLGLLA